MAFMPRYCKQYSEYNIIRRLSFKSHIIHLFYKTITTMDKEVAPIDIEKLLQKLTADSGNRQIKFTENQIKAVVFETKKVFLSQPMLLELQAPIKIVGDIHGQFVDLINIFKKGGFPPQSNYLFLGDYVDRGKYSLQTIMLLFVFKLKYPQNFFLLRGNHEAAEINKLYGFYDECKRKQSLKIWKIFIDCFNSMPIAALIEEKIMCMHGGLSPELKRINKIKTINRPTDIPSSGLLCDVLWSDPAEIKGFQDNTQRGISYLFGNDALTTFLKDNDLDLICRSHQIVEQGYEFFGKRQLVTIFSAPNYCGIFENWGAIMSVNSDLICSFEVLKPPANSSKGEKKKTKTPKYIN